MTDSQKNMKSKLQLMNDDELASLLNDVQKETLKNTKKSTHSKITKIASRATKSRSLPFIRKKTLMRTEKPEYELKQNEPASAMTSKVHYMADEELEGILNNLNNPKRSKIENVGVNELTEDRLKPSPHKPQTKVNVDSIPLQEYSKVYLVVDPDAVKNTENQAMLTDLIGKVIAARRSQRRDDDDDLSAKYAKLAERADNDDDDGGNKNSYRDNDRRRERDRERDREDDRKESKGRDRDRDAASDTKTTFRSRTARPVSRGQNREMKKYSEEIF